MSSPRRDDAILKPWLDAIIAHHMAFHPPSHFYKAIRALSARYVESRGHLPDRSPLDSWGKRRAFAAFYAPLHLLTTRAILRALSAHHPELQQLRKIIDLGCGTGVAGAAWALECDEAIIEGVDRHPWPLEEARRNWDQLGVHGRTRRADLVDAAERLAGGLAGRRLERTAAVLGWSANELEPQRRARLLKALMRLVDRGAFVLVIEPIARSVTPWWESWVDAFGQSRARVRSDDWKFDAPLPPALAAISEAAGFSERPLSARTLLIAPGDEATSD